MRAHNALCWVVSAGSNGSCYALFSLQLHRKRPKILEGRCRALSGKESLAGQRRLAKPMVAPRVGSNPTYFFLLNLLQS